VGYETERSATGKVFIWIERQAMDRPTAEGSPGEELSSLLASGGYTPETLPTMLRALSRNGGPERQIKEAQRRGAKLACDDEATFWLK
jgi:hypothetical protein